MGGAYPTEAVVSGARVIDFPITERDEKLGQETRRMCQNFFGTRKCGKVLLARAAGRATEMALRLSIGASRRQLLAQLLTESRLLAVLGCSLVVARWTLGLIRRWFLANN